MEISHVRVLAEASNEDTGWLPGNHPTASEPECNRAKLGHRKLTVIDTHCLGAWMMHTGNRAPRENRRGRASGLNENQTLVTSSENREA